MFLAVSSLMVPEERRSGRQAAVRDRSTLVDRHDGFRRLSLVERQAADACLSFLDGDSQEDLEASVQPPDVDHAHGDLDDAVTPDPLQRFDVLRDSEEGD
ncbi:hypothetical protein BRD56_11965 [Thermoplasmatales archaeon SW_10_69_26]|nr:MAG: hypothetical protein BRD56_11965 [Thermoplasmatales archaeon SW_10_69_26]